MAGNIQEICREILIYQQILDISTDGFLVVDTDSRIIEINQAYCSYLGVERIETIGKHVLEVVKNSKLPEILNSGETEVNVLHKLVEGQSLNREKVVVVTRAPVKNGQNVIAAVGQIKFSKKTMELANRLQEMDQELEYYKKELQRIAGTKYSFENMIGKNPKFLEVKRIAEKAARNDFTVLILGGTGTGKEVFANAIHYASKRKDRPFIRVNCAAIPAELLESELFGYEEGSFTGARRGGKKGKFELADSGTIFLDEIGDMPISMQAKILRVLQENELEKVGSYETIPINVRVIAATNQDLEQKMHNNTFRSDLYYRLNVIQLEIPPLRERSDDIPEFVNYFLQELNEKYDTDICLEPEAFQVLIRHNWAGNIRELRNVIERAFSLVDGNIIKANTLLVNVVNKMLDNGSSPDGKLDNIMGEYERDTLIRMLQKNKYNCKLTAKELGIHRTTLYKKLNRLNIEVERK